MENILPVTMLEGLRPPRTPPLWASGPHWLICPMIRGVNQPMGAGGPEWGVLGGGSPAAPGPSSIPGSAKKRPLYTRGPCSPLLWMDNILPVKMLGGLGPPRTPHYGPPAPFGWFTPTARGTKPTYGGRRPRVGGPRGGSAP